MSTYRYFLEPIGPEANEALAELLNQQGDSATTYERRRVKIGGKPAKPMYEVPEHFIITIAGHSVHQKNFRAYVQQGEGEIRPYSLYKNIGKKVSRTKEVQRVKRALKKKFG